METMYDVTFARIGTATIRASSKEEALEKAKQMPAQCIAWTDDFSPTDIEELPEERPYLFRHKV